MKTRSFMAMVGWWTAGMSLLIAAAAQAEDAARSGAEFVKEGNKLLAEFKYADALAAYDKAAEQLPDSAAVAYDRGVALYRLGEFAKAEPAFQDALKSAHTELEAKAKYNLGRCAHQSALVQKDNLEAAINDLSRAVRFYQDAIQLDAKDQDAQKNKELAERLLAFLQKKLEQQKKDQPTSQPSSQPSSQPDEKQSTSQPTSQPQEGEQGEDQKGDQQKEQQGKQDGDKQDKASQGKKGDKDKQKGEEKKEGQQDQSSGDQDENKMKKEEAEPMLQEARDAERQRREAKREQMIRIRGLVPVKQDW